jgi:hypothetical protein
MKFMAHKALSALLFLLIVSLFASNGIGQASFDNPGVQSSGPAHPDRAQAVQLNYLPLVNKSKITPGLIAAENHSGAKTAYMDKAKAANIQWARVSAAVS